MQPYPRSPDLFWPGHLHGTGCLSAQAMDTGFPIVVWRLYFGPGCAWVRVSVTPPALAGVLGGCVWVRVVVSPLFSLLGFAVLVVGLGFRPAPHHSWLGFWGVRGCVRAPPVPRRSRFGCAVWVCVLGLGFRLRPATPRGGVGVCVCVCVLVPPGLLHLLAWGEVRDRVLGPQLQPRPATPGWGVGLCLCLCARPACTPPFLAGVCGVGECAGLGLRLYPALLGWGVRVCVRSCVCPACTPPVLAGCCVCVCGFGFCLLSGSPGFLAWVLGRVASCARRVRFLSPSGGPPVAWRCAGVALGGVCPPPSPLVCFLGGASWHGVSWLCGVGRGLSRSWVSWFPSPLPLSFGLRLGVFLVFLFFFPSPPQRGVCLRVQAVPSSGGPPLSFWCCQFWLGGPPVPLRGVLSSVPSGWGVWPPLVVWVGGFVAVGLSGAPPPCFFFGGSACSSLCLPLAGARTGPHSVWLSGLLLVLAFC